MMYIRCQAKDLVSGSCALGSWDPQNIKHRKCYSQVHVLEEFCHQSGGGTEGRRHGNKGTVIRLLQ